MGGVNIASFREKSRMERLGKPRQGRKGRRLSEREASESNLVAQAKANFAGCLDFARHDRRTCEMDSKLIQHE